MELSLPNEIKARFRPFHMSCDVCDAKFYLIHFGSSITF